MMQDALFYVPATVLLASAMAVVFARNPVYGVLALILAFFNAAALFLLLGAEFIAMVLIIVYVGAVAVLFLFVVMMLNIYQTTERAHMSQLLPLGLAVSAILFAEILFFMNNASLAPPAAPVEGALTNTQNLALILYTEYMPLFEIAGLILLLAMVGAIFLMHTKSHRPRQQVAAQTDPSRHKSVKLKNVKVGGGIE